LIEELRQEKGLSAEVVSYINMEKERILTLKSFFIISLAIHGIFILLTCMQIQSKQREITLEIDLLNWTGGKQSGVSNVKKEIVKASVQTAMPEDQKVVPEEEVAATEEKMPAVERTEVPHVNSVQVGGRSGEIGSGAGSQLSNPVWIRYLLLVKEKIEAQKRYPRESLERKEEGEVNIKFTILANGSLLDVTVAQSSGCPSLDREGIMMVKRASPFPPPPENTNLTITKLPVTFKLTR